MLVDPQAMQAVLAAVDSGKNGFATLFLRDGSMLATAPENPGLLEKNWVDAPMFKVHLPRSSIGTVQQVMVRDGTERVYSYRALVEYPLVISMGVSMTDTLAAWRERSWYDGVLWALVSTAFFLGAAALSRNYRLREAAQQDAAELARETQAVIDHAADGILTLGVDNIVTSANPVCAMWFGWPQAEITGRNVRALLPAWPAEAAPPAVDTLHRFESPGRRRDGSEFSAEVAVTEVQRHGQPLRIAMLRDVTEPRLAQAAVKQAHDLAQRSEAFLRNITDNLPLRIAYVDRELRYCFVNQAHCERFLLPRSAIIGRTREEITGVPLSQPLVQALHQVLQGQPQRLELEEGDGSGPRVVETFLVPDFFPRGDADLTEAVAIAPPAVCGFFSASADVTERHLQRRQLEHALVERETLLREVYHRVKNNLQVVQSLLNLQRRALPEGPARGALDDSMQRVYAMALVHEKLYQTGDLDAVLLPDYVQDLLRHLGDASGASRRQIRLVADVDDITAALELALPLGLLVTELVANSLKHGFRPDRGGHIRVQLRRHPSGLKLVVQDDGLGLPPDFDLGHSASMGLQLACSLAGQLGGNLSGSSVAAPQAAPPGSIRSSASSGAVFEALLSRFTALHNHQHSHTALSQNGSLP